jgi:hypothetical protein
VKYDIRFVTEDCFLYDYLSFGICSLGEISGFHGSEYEDDFSSGMFRRVVL